MLVGRFHLFKKRCSRRRGRLRALRGYQGRRRRGAYWAGPANEGETTLIDAEVLTLA